MPRKTSVVTELPQSDIRYDPMKLVEDFYAFADALSDSRVDDSRDGQVRAAWARERLERLADIEESIADLREASRQMLRETDGVVAAASPPGLVPEPDASEPRWLLDVLADLASYCKANELAQARIAILEAMHVAITTIPPGPDEVDH